MRIYSVALILVLSGCGADPGTDDKVASAQPDDRIECALNDAIEFTKDCAIERGDGSVLTLRHRDGGFRRVTLAADGTIDAADGAGSIEVKTLGDRRTEITIDRNRYRLPATP